VVKSALRFAVSAFILAKKNQSLERERQNAESPTMEQFLPGTKRRTENHDPSHKGQANRFYVSQLYLLFKKHKAIGVAHLGIPPKASSMNPWR
jgi:hypothetical protein